MSVKFNMMNYNNVFDALSKPEIFLYDIKYLVSSLHFSHSGGGKIFVVNVNGLFALDEEPPEKQEQLIQYFLGGGDGRAPKDLKSNQGSTCKLD